MNIGYKSDIGKKRNVNQDSFYISKEGFGEIYLIADGMGGHKAGEIASNMAKEIISKDFNENKDKLCGKKKIKSIMKEIIEKANTKIYLKSLENPEYKGMGTTVTLSYIYEDKILTGHVGDSRAYILKRRDEELIQITEDHSYINELIKENKITKKEAKVHPDRNLITRAVGSSSILEIDFFEVEYEKDDILILCSDGLTNMVSEEVIKNVFLSDLGIQKSCEILVDEANNLGGTDNITIIAVKFE